MWLVSCVWCVFAPLPGVSSMDAELCPVGRVAHAWGTLLGAEGLAGGTFHWEVFGAHLLPENDVQAQLETIPKNCARNTGTVRAALLYLSVVNISTHAKDV
jgi:hypothetical protein